MSSGCALVLVLDAILVAIIWSDARPVILLLLAIIIVVTTIYRLSLSDHPLWLR
jgi:hypothetical protein